MLSGAVRSTAILTAESKHPYGHCGRAFPLLFL